MTIALLTCYITTEYHVVLYAYMYKQITGSMTHIAILAEVLVRFSSFLLKRLLY